MGFIFEHLFSGIFTNVSVRKVLADGDERVAVFDVDVAGYDQPAEGLILVVLGADGGITEVTIFLRPLDALQALADEMGRRLGGPRPA